MTKGIHQPTKGMITPRWMSRRRPFPVVAAGGGVLGNGAVASGNLVPVGGGVVGAPEY
jgi:hypothetical protein